MVGQWREDGRLRSRIGQSLKMTKSKAREKLAAIVKPINERDSHVVDQDVTTKDFVEKEWLPFYKRKWKESTAMTNEDRVNHHIVTEFGIANCEPDAARSATIFWIRNHRCRSARLIISDGILTKLTINTPLAKDYVMHRHIRPALKMIGFDWLDFHVLRRTHSSLMRELGVDPKGCGRSTGAHSGREPECVHGNVARKTDRRCTATQVRVCELMFLSHRFHRIARSVSSVTCVEESPHPKPVHKS